MLTKFFLTLVLLVNGHESLVNDADHQRCKNRISKITNIFCFFVLKSELYLYVNMTDAGYTMMHMTFTGDLPYVTEVDKIPKEWKVSSKEVLVFALKKGCIKLYFSNESIFCMRAENLRATTQFKYVYYDFSFYQEFTKPFEAKMILIQNRTRNQF